MQGKVLWFNNHKGYGEIEVSKTERLFFTYQEIVSDKQFRSISQGAIVNFTKSKDLLFDSYRARNVIEVSKMSKKSKGSRSEFSAS